MVISSALVLADSKGSGVRDLVTEIEHLLPNILYRAISLRAKLVG